MWEVALAGDHRSQLNLRCLYLAIELAVLLRGWYLVVLELSGFPERAELRPSVCVSWKWSQTTIPCASQV